jgi:hypothetical protein
MPPPPPPKSMLPRAPSPPALEMQESREIYHHYLRQTKSNARIEPHESRGAKRTAYPSSTLPSLREAGLEYEGAMNWKDFLSHSHINHDATRCATCLAAKLAGREGDVQGPKFEDLQMAGREGEVQGPKLKDLPPVLPPLRPFSPMMGGLDLSVWEGDGHK